MNLEKLEISGFKSFMSRIEFDFSRGITAILGPNGCGKSNVVDSIRWVLGEQRTRMLRNSKMENVLFNGTRLRKPLGMAEVHMTLSNSDHSLNLDFDEITIGRRLYRSGQSEYLVNGRPVRLKEIRNLLVDTGLGNSAYSIIERDMVERVLSEKGDEKRRLIEEAAGVMRYRIQREEAERKIAATESDLLRLDDILSELEKECRSLKYQMGKARRYATLKEQADRLETISLKATLFEMLAEKDDLNTEREHHEGIRLADDNEILIRENRLQTTRVEAAEQEKKLSELSERRYEITTSLQQNEEKIAIHTERITASRARIVEDDAEVSRSHEKLAGLADELTSHREVVAEKETALAELREKVHARREELTAVAARLDEARDVLRNRKQLALDLVREKEREKGALEHIEGSIAQLAEKQDTVEAQLDELSAEESTRVEELTAIELKVGEQQQKLNHLHADLTRLTENLDRAREQAVKLDEEHAIVTREHATLTEKTEFLKRIKAEHARWTREAVGEFEGLSGVLSDLVRVEKEFRRCFEACLAPILHSVVADSRGDAVGCLEKILSGDTGRVQILFPDRFGVVQIPRRGDGIIAAAAELVECDPSVAPFLRSYLEGVAVVDDVLTAARVIEEGRARRVVTLDGVFYDGPGKIIVAGSDDIEMTIFEYETKLDELAVATEAAEARFARVKERREEVDVERSNIQNEIGTIRTALAEEERKFGELVESRRSAELHLVRVKEKIGSLGDAINETRDALAQMRLKLEAARARESGEVVQLENADLSELETTVTEREREKDALGEVVSKLRLDEVTLSAEVETAQTKIRNLERLEEELRGLIQSREEDAERCREQIRLSEEDTLALRAAISERHAEKETVEAEITEANERYATLKETRDGLEGEVKEMKDQRDAKRENLERVSVSLATIEERISGIVEKARERHNQDLDPYLRDRTKFDPTEWEDFDKEALEDVKGKLETFGPVNMLAVEEFEEKNERLEFLTRQKADLVEAKESLRQAIRRINKEARRLLNETFEKVRTNFRETFLTLFNGGEVDLMWTDSDDPLEANIKIVASPRGKRIKDISNLSSGERALVALSLLFGIYLVKPSPFCVFDEVDAPLDDANIGRFVSMLEAFTDHTQFIVITHNKKTMEAAGHLYGVTMEEPGVSKLISVHLDDAERFKRRGVTGAATDAAGGETEAARA